MKKRILAIACGVLFAIGMNGQTSDELSLPELATPSPKATMMERFGYYPTNLYTGLIDITIPIHTIEVQGIQVPVEIKYHASGLKYDDLPMEVGYGWTLMAGGEVSYSSHSAGLFPPNGQKIDPFIKKVEDIQLNDKTIPSSIYSDQCNLDFIMNGKKDQYQTVGWYCDSEYDVFNFSFLGYSGQYYWLDYDHGFSSEPSIVRMNGGLWPTATDENGNRYEFGVKDADGYYRNFTYYLTKVSTQCGANAVNFVYREINSGASSSMQVCRPFIDNTLVYSRNSKNNATTVDYGGHSGISIKMFNTPILTEINYDGGKVLFFYSSTSIRSLERIEVRNINGVTVKSVTFRKTNNAYLDGIDFYGVNGKYLYSYGFEYNGVKPEGYVPIDYWGYINGSSAVKPYTLYVPKFPDSDVTGNRGMNREPNEYYMKLGMLKKIVYPTKGYSTFTYEGHHSGGKLYGGLRIKEVKNYDADSCLLESKRYEYVSSRVVRPVYPIHYLTCSNVVISDEKMAAINFSPAVDYTMHYQTYSAFPNCSYFAQGSTVVYPSVTEYTGTEGNLYGTTSYNYTDFYDDFFPTTKRGQIAEIPKWSNNWKCGKLLSKIVKDSIGHTVYSLRNEYAEVNREDYLNLKVLPYYDISGYRSGEVKDAFTQYPAFANAIGGSLYDYYNYYITRGNYVVRRSREYRDGVTHTTDYQYNGIGQVAEETTTDSDGSQWTTRYKRAFDLGVDSEPGDIYDKMYQQNITGPVLEKEVYKDGVLVNKIVNEYKSWGNLIALQYVRQPVGGTTYQPRITYLDYDNYGNPVSISKDDMENVKYLWSYKGLRPIAVLKGGNFDMLDEALANRVAQAASPSSADMAVIEALRDMPAFYRARLTTFHYTPSLNLDYTVSPNGTKTNYEYDDFDRLVRVKDHNGKVLEEYQYDYKQ